MRLHAAVGLSYAAWGLSGGAVLTCLPAAAGQQPVPPAQAAPLPPDVLFKQAQSEIAAGRYDVAAETLKRFLAGNPSDAVYQALTRTRATTLLDLRRVVTWSDEPAANAEAKKTVEAIIAAGEAANAKLYRDPARIARFVRNLGESPEERVYAEQQLRLSGDAVVPVMVDALRTTSDPLLRTGITGAVKALNADQLPGLLAATVGLPTDLKLAILKAAVARPDVTALSASPDTDLMPHLWYYSASRREEERPLREFASLALDGLTGGTFTLNNYGPLGVDGSAAIINHPEVAILGIGRILPRPWVVDGQVLVRQVTELTLAFDHRACDGGTAGGFLRYVADCLERPSAAMVEL